MKKQEEELAGQAPKRYKQRTAPSQTVPNVEKIERGSKNNTTAIGIVPPVGKLMNSGVKSLATNMRKK